MQSYDGFLTKNGIYIYEMLSLSGDNESIEIDRDR